MGIQELLSVGGTAIESPVSKMPSQVKRLAGLTELLSARNGFYAFDGALLVRPLSRSRSPIGLIEWNAPELWKSAFGNENLEQVVFFSEDVFGGQFGIGPNGIFAFDPERGEIETIGSSIDDWIRTIMEDSDFRTGQPLGTAWSAIHGPLAAGQRLVPKVPFVTGGAFAVENLYCMDELKAMRWRAHIAQQLRSVPDGCAIQFIVDRPSTLNSEELDC